jgi:hypothetical protein
MPTTHRISSFAAVAAMAATLSLPAAASARPIYDSGIIDESVAQHVALTAAKWQAYDNAVRAAHASPAPAAAASDDGGFPLPMAGGVIAIVMLSFGGAAVAVKRRKTVHPVVPTC